MGDPNVRQPSPYNFEEFYSVRSRQFIRDRARRFPCHQYGLDTADLEQDGAIGLWRASQTFDTRHGVSILTYARKFIDGEMSRALSHAKRLRDVAPTFIADLATPPADERCIDDVDTRLSLQRALAVLTAREQYVVMAIDGYGMTQSMLGGVLGITQQAVQKTRAGALVKLRTLLNVA